MMKRGTFMGKCVALVLGVFGLSIPDLQAHVQPSVLLEDATELQLRHALCDMLWEKFKGVESVPITSWHTTADRNRSRKRSLEYTAHLLSIGLVSSAVYYPSLISTQSMTHS